MSNPCSCKVKYILESYASRGDVCGNRYWWHRLTSVESGNSITFEACSDGNARYLVNKYAGPMTYPELYATAITDRPIRDHNRMTKKCIEKEMYEGSDKLNTAIAEL